jgi:hypothetical protein
MIIDILYKYYLFFNFSILYYILITFILEKYIDIILFLFN